MADIPVERKEKSGLPWWLIPLLLLLLLPLLFFGFCNRNTTVVDNTNGNANANRANLANNNGNVRAANSISATNTSNVAVVTNTGNANMSVGNSTNNAALNSGPVITDTNFFAGANDKMTLAGRQAEIKNVRVNRVLSDRVFTVKSGSGEMFVMLDENLDSPVGK